MSGLPADLAGSANALGVRITGVLRSNDKTLLAVGVLDGRRVAVKWLLSADPFWAAKLRQEIRICQVFAASPPPVQVPRLVYTDSSRLLVTSWLDGRPLDEDRYPGRALPAGDVDAVLDCLLTLNRWLPPAGAATATFDYPDRFRRYRASGYLTADDHTALTCLLERCGPPGELNHGDPVPANILLTPGHPGVALVDWEFTGLFLPGFDLAMLYALAGARTPHLRDRTEQIIVDGGHQEAFATNLAAVLTRELRIHQTLPAGPVRDARLPLLEAAWQEARKRIHRLAAGRQ